MTKQSLYKVVFLCIGAFVSTFVFANDPFAPLVQPVEESVQQSGEIAKTVIQIIMAGGIMGGIYTMVKGNVGAGFSITISTIAIGTVLLLII